MFFSCMNSKYKLFFIFLIILSSVKILVSFLDKRLPETSDTILSGILAQRTGYTLTFIISAVVSLLSVFVILKAYAQENIENR